MTPDQMAELAARLRDMRSRLNDLDDLCALEDAADLIDRMAQQSSRHVALVCPQCSWTLERREPLDRQEGAA